MIRLLLAALLASAAIVNTAALAQWKRPAPKIDGCASARHIIEAEAFRHGVGYKDAHVFRDREAFFLSRWLGMAFPGVEPVVVVSYSDGSAALISFVGAPECWRLQIMERRK